jgi:hypothetical protein
MYFPKITNEAYSAIFFGIMKEGDAHSDEG